jgi:GntR family transcriptional regulator
MFDSINIESSVPVYEQIENLVQFAIASGRVKAGDQLPTMMGLAERLHLNMNTITKSYHDLQLMGIVDAQRGVGVFIAKGVEAKCRKACREQITVRLKEVAGEAKAAGFSRDEIRTALSEAYASEAGPYASAPDSLLALLKQKKYGKRS